MAKLSLKGIVSLSHQIIKDGKTNTHNIELFQDDFEDCVMLTVEEAKEISFHLYKLATLYELQILELDPDKKLIKPLAKTYERLNDKICQAMKTKRIKQAEGK